MLHRKRIDDKGLFTYAQAYLEYQADSLTSEHDVLDERDRDLPEVSADSEVVEPVEQYNAKWFLNRILLFPEYIIAKRKLRTEYIRRGLGANALTLEEFAEQVKSAVEQRRDAAIPLWKDSLSGKLHRIERELDDGRLHERLVSTIKQIYMWADANGVTDEARWKVRHGYVPDEFKVESQE